MLRVLFTLLPFLAIANVDAGKFYPVNRVCVLHFIVRGRHFDERLIGLAPQRGAMHQSTGQRPSCSWQIHISSSIRRRIAVCLIR